MREVLRLWAVLRPLQGRIIVMAVLTTVTALLGSSVPWFYRELINFLTNEQISAWLAWLVPEGASVVTTLFVLVAAYLGVLLVEDILVAFWQYLSPITRGASWQMINLESLERIQRLSMSFFYARPAGAVFEKINAGAREGFRVIQIITIDIWPTLIRFAVAVWSVSILNMPMAIGLGGVMVLFAVVGIWRTKINEKAEEIKRPSMEEHVRKWIGTLALQELVKQFAREKDVEAEMATLYNYLYDTQRVRYLWVAILDLVQELLWKLAIALVYGYGGYLVLVEKSLTVGDLILIVAFLDRLMGPLSYILNLYDEMQTYLVSLRRMFEIWDVPVEVVDAPNAKKLNVSRGEVEFDNVTFYYRDKEGGVLTAPALKNFSLKIKGGEKVALVGPSGAGKSTIAKMLLRFYEPDSGRILVDGTDTRLVTQRSLRQNIAVIMQDVAVFNESVLENMKYAKKSATTTQIGKALKMASLDGLIASFPQKLNTLLGERGVRLSGGERQRLGIARALLRNSPIFIFDEATSALDSENEKRVQEAMWRTIKNRTAIIIAHRLSTVRKADRIVVVRNGRIVQQGKHTELLKDKKGYYARLVKMQNILH